MNTVLKYTTAAVLTGAMALALAGPSQARNGRNAAAIGGFVAGAAVGAAVANSNNRYYYNEPAYAYEPAPSYSYRSAPTYTYEPSYGYEQPYYANQNTGCSTSGAMYGHRTDNSACY